MRSTMNEILKFFNFFKVAIPILLLTWKIQDYDDLDIFVKSLNTNLNTKMEFVIINQRLLANSKRANSKFTYSCDSLFLNCESANEELSECDDISSTYNINNCDYQSSQYDLENYDYKSSLCDVENCDYVSSQYDLVDYDYIINDTKSNINTKHETLFKNYESYPELEEDMRIKKKGNFSSETKRDNSYCKDKIFDSLYYLDKYEEPYGVNRKIMRKSLNKISTKKLKQNGLAALFPVVTVLIPAFLPLLPYIFVGYAFFVVRYIYKNKNNHCLIFKIKQRTCIICTILIHINYECILLGLRYFEYFFIT
ncbi:Plasmodium exported protein, unknown function [Plasmodium gonderi]|uniref:Variable surface protein n=1 Tax=Plasmodium gonderi TaxID=77519 RepID=A0A1Y1JL00_PLAGO|nr:Plasmodium exported protein, unknown function [Plasmodium gonderi]GAW83209.1 Plasmodium exported protein, unknown function [Plasmodium gonderi]